jgi:deoxyribodipyrimidine photolyase-related protein
MPGPAIPAAALRVVLGDQLSPGLAGLEGLDRARDTVLMAEVREEASYVPHHPKKLAFLFSAMRHFAEALRAEGVRVRYVSLNDPDNTHSIPGELDRAVVDLAPDAVILTECGEYRLDRALQDWRARASVPVEMRTDTRFLASKAEFARWAEGRKALRMEYFYREMRRRYGILLDPDGQPVGGKWNYDADNRKPPEPGLFQPPAPPEAPPDDTTRHVLDIVAREFPDAYGSLDGFTFAVTAEGAEVCARAFFRERLSGFGDYQDAMLRGEAVLYHSLLSLYLNAGLLDPLDLCRRAEEAYRSGAAPLNAAEGFIRQILGWREYVRGLYWLKMPDYAETNALQAHKDLPAFFWTGETEMACLAESICQTLQNAYAHHIQRLMVIGNFALLAGLEPKQVCEWYLAVYADAYEWVELPNTHGMALFADGGIMASKPYAASGKYIDRMSDYCAGCRYDPKKNGDEAESCPFNALYWQFLARNEKTLSGNPRMGMIYKTLARMKPDKRAALFDRAERFLETLT